MSDDEQRRLERFGRLQPPSFSGTEAEDAQGFLDKCHRILRTAVLWGCLQLVGLPSAAQAHVVPVMSDDEQRRLESWWEAYEMRRPVGTAPLTWEGFPVLFLEKFVSQSRREELRRQFEQLHQDDLSVTHYEMRFSELALHAVLLVPTNRERIRRFIDGLTYQLQFLMTR
ncbi:uncharacterized protein [Nicotiana tomentosiformis]|uniref:uncharacterized protein n=1 Tax=Nicotiana tomentosiformis TaxID=4098 RepID=UPI00388CD204